MTRGTALRGSIALPLIGPVTVRLMFRSMILGRRRTDRLLLLWFGAMTTWLIAHGSVSLAAIGTDANLYRFAADSFLHGIDPWNRAGGDWSVYQFAGLPPTILAFVPFAFLPSPLVMWGWVGISAVAGIWTIRRLRLPLYWIAFPPLFGGIVSGNPHLLVVALALTKWSPLGAMLKIYGIVPAAAEARWRPLAATAALLIGTVAVAPGLWAAYLSQASMISARLVFQAGSYSAYGIPALMIVTVALLLLAFNRREIGWLVVPVLWPATEFIYSTMAMPVAGPLMAGILAIPLRGSPVIAILVVAFARVLVARRAVARKGDRRATAQIGPWVRRFGRPAGA